MAHGAHGASGWVSSGNRPDREHEGPEGASDGGIRSAERRLGSDRRRSKGNKRHVLQRAKRRSATPRPATGLELGMMAEVIEDNRQGMRYVSRAVDQCEATFRADLAKMRSEMRKEMATERNNVLVMMTSLTKLWKLFAAKSGGAMVTDASGEFGDCGVEVDVTGEGRLAGVLQECDDTEGLAALSRCAVRDAAMESTGGEASVGEAVCESGVDVGRSSMEGPGDGGMSE